MFSSWIFQLPGKRNLCSPSVFTGKPAPCFMNRSIHVRAGPRNSASGSIPGSKVAKISPLYSSVRSDSSGNCVLSKPSSYPAAYGTPRNEPSSA